MLRINFSIITLFLFIASQYSASNKNYAIPNAYGIHFIRTMPTLDTLQNANAAEVIMSKTEEVKTDELSGWEKVSLFFLALALLLLVIFVFPFLACSVICSDIVGAVAIAIIIMIFDFFVLNFSFYLIGKSMKKKAKRWRTLSKEARKQEANKYLLICGVTGLIALYSAYLSFVINNR